jgi:hypothetical protein
MGVFGPKYPRALQQVVNHAERFCDLLARLSSAASRDAQGGAWLTGRSREVEVVLKLGLADWASGQRSMEDAARSISAYLLDLHAGARERFGLKGELECCEEDVFLTAPAGDDAETRVFRPEERRACAVDDDTWFDPSTLLRESDRSTDNTSRGKGDRPRHGVRAVAQAGAMTGRGPCEE